MVHAASLTDGRSPTLPVRLAAELRADLWFYVAVGGYVAAAGLLALYVQATELFHPFLYVGMFLWRAGWIALLGSFFWAAYDGIRRNPRSPLSGLLASLRRLLMAARLLPPRFLAGILMFTAMAVFYGAFTSVKNMLPVLGPFGWDPFFADVDRSLHGGVDPGPLLAQHTGPIATLVIDYVYAVVWGFLLIGVAFLAATSTRYAHLRTRFFAAFVLCWVVLGSILASLFLSAGPVYFGHVTGDATRFVIFTQNEIGFAPKVQAYLWEQFSGGDVTLGSGISAFPSMHLATATLIALYLSALSRPLGALGAIFVAVIQFGSVRLGWHYAVDGYFSIAFAAAAWWAIGRLQTYRCSSGSRTSTTACASS